jgi:hypothetical protein
VSYFPNLNQPLVTTGGGALPLPTGALPTQAVRPKASITEQIVTNSFFISSAPFEILQTIIVLDSFQLVQKSHIPKPSQLGATLPNSNRPSDGRRLVCDSGRLWRTIDLRSLLRLVSPPAVRGCSSMVEQQPSKLMTRVRFPSPAPTKSGPFLKTTFPAWPLGRSWEGP